MRRRVLPLLVLLFLLHALPFLTRPVLLGGDEPHFALIAHSLAVDGDVDLANDYQAVAEGSAAAGRRFRGQDLERHLLRVGERDLPAHPLGLPLLVAPLLRALDVGSPGAAPDWLLGLLSLGVSFTGLVCGRRLLVEYLGDERVGTVVALALHFSTPLWFTGRSFFTEPYLAALPVLAVYAWTRQRSILAGALLGAALLIKESALVLIVPVLLGLAVHGDRRRALRLGLGPALGLAVFVGKSLLLTGRPLTLYHPFELGDPLAGAWGLLWDLRHGLLPFAPLAPLALLAVLGLPRRGSAVRDPLATAWLAAGGLFLLTACWASWGGGSCFGPRLLVPLLPMLALPLGTAWQRWGGRGWFWPTFAVLAALGFALELAAAVDPFRAFWEISAPALLAAGPLVSVGGFLLGLWGLMRLRPRQPV